MAKRLHDTECWRKQWFRMLPPNAKLLWLYLLDVCDCAGIVEVDDRDQISFFLGCPITENDFAHLSKQVRKIDSKRLLILDFIEFQHGKLHDSHKMHANIVSRLAKFDLKYPIDTLSRLPDRDKGEGEGEGEGNSSSNTIPDVSTHVDIPSEHVSTYTDMSGQVKTCDKRDPNPPDEFKAAKIYAAYPRHVARKPAMKAILAAMKKIDALELWNLTLDYATSVEGKDPTYIPHPATWYNAERWNDVEESPETQEDALESI